MGALASERAMAIDRDDVRHCGGDGESCRGRRGADSVLFCVLFVEGGDQASVSHG